MGKPLLTQFCPTLRAGHVTHVTRSFLQERGIRALILDLDNTLVPWKGRELVPEIAAWVRELQEGDVRLCIVSNTHRPGRLKALAAALGVLYVPSGGKPRRRGFYRALEAMGASGEETAVVGDQVLTDIWGGNRCGLLTILVEPLSREEFVGTRLVSRRIEGYFLRRLERLGVLPAHLPAETSSGSGDTTTG